MSQTAESAAAESTVLSPLKRAEAELAKLNNAIFGQDREPPSGVPPAPGSDYEGQRLRAGAAMPPPTKGESGC